MPQTCGNALQGLATGLGNQLGKPVKVLRTPAEVEAYKKELGDTKPAR